MPEEEDSNPDRPARHQRDVGAAAKTLLHLAESCLHKKGGANTNEAELKRASLKLEEILFGAVSRLAEPIAEPSAAVSGTDSPSCTAVDLEPQFEATHDTASGDQKQSSWASSSGQASVQCLLDNDGSEWSESTELPGSSHAQSVQALQTDHSPTGEHRVCPEHGEKFKRRSAGDNLDAVKHDVLWMLSVIQSMAQPECASVLQRSAEIQIQAVAQGIVSKLKQNSVDESLQEPAHRQRRLSDAASLHILTLMWSLLPKLEALSLERCEEAAASTLGSSAHRCLVALTEAVFVRLGELQGEMELFAEDSRRTCRALQGMLVELVPGLPSRPQMAAAVQPALPALSADRLCTAASVPAVDTMQPPGVQCTPRLEAIETSLEANLSRSQATSHLQPASSSCALYANDHHRQELPISEPPLTPCGLARQLGGILRKDACQPCLAEGEIHAAAAHIATAAGLQRVEHGANRAGTDETHAATRYMVALTRQLLPLAEAMEADERSRYLQVLQQCLEVLTDVAFAHLAKRQGQPQCSELAAERCRTHGLLEDLLAEWRRRSPATTLDEQRLALGAPVSSELRGRETRPEPKNGATMLSQVEAVLSADRDLENLTAHEKTVMVNLPDVIDRTVEAIKTAVKESSDPTGKAEQIIDSIGHDIASDVLTCSLPGADENGEPWARSQRKALEESKVQVALLYIRVLAWSLLPRLESISTAVLQKDVAGNGVCAPLAKSPISVQVVEAVRKSFGRLTHSVLAGLACNEEIGEIAMHRRQVLLLQTRSSVDTMLVQSLSAKLQRPTPLQFGCVSSANVKQSLSREEASESTDAWETLKMRACAIAPQSSSSEGIAPSVMAVGSDTEQIAGLVVDLLTGPTPAIRVLRDTVEALSAAITTRFLASALSRDSSTCVKGCVPRQGAGENSLAVAASNYMSSLADEVMKRLAFREAVATECAWQDGREESSASQVAEVTRRGLQALLAAVRAGLKDASGLPVDGEVVGIRDLQEQSCAELHAALSCRDHLDVTECDEKAPGQAEQQVVQSAVCAAPGLLSWQFRPPLVQQAAARPAVNPPWADSGSARGVIAWSASSCPASRSHARLGQSQATSPVRYRPMSGTTKVLPPSKQVHSCVVPVSVPRPRSLSPSVSVPPGVCIAAPAVQGLPIAVSVQSPLSRGGHSSVPMPRRLVSSPLRATTPVPLSRQSSQAATIVVSAVPGFCNGASPVRRAASCSRASSLGSSSVVGLHQSTVPSVAFSSYHGSTSRLGVSQSAATLPMSQHAASVVGKVSQPARGPSPLPGPVRDLPSSTRPPALPGSAVQERPVSARQLVPSNPAHERCRSVPRPRSISARGERACEQQSGSA